MRRIILILYALVRTAADDFCPILRAIDSSECPSDPNIGNCNNPSLVVGDFCEGDGECGTSDINNCDDYDVYEILVDYYYVDDYYYTENCNYCERLSTKTRKRYIKEGICSKKCFKVQSTNFKRFTTIWCAAFTGFSLFVLYYVCRASPTIDRKFIRVWRTILVSQFDYGGDTLYIGYERFASKTYFYAAVFIYFVPLVAFLAVNICLVCGHVSRIASACCKICRAIIIRAKDWSEFADCFIDLLTRFLSSLLFLLIFPVCIIIYTVLLFLFITSKLMSVSTFTRLFYQLAGKECNEESFNYMFKCTLLIEILFESSGELVIALLNIFALKRLGVKPSIFSVISIVGGAVMLVSELWPFFYNICIKCQGCRGGVLAVRRNVPYTADRTIPDGQSKKENNSGGKDKEDDEKEDDEGTLHTEANHDDVENKVSQRSSTYPTVD